MLLLYFQLIGYGVWVALGVVEEKSSRVVELLLATLRPWQLLAGKVIGIGLLGLAQLVLTGLVGIAAGLATGAIDVPSGILGVAGQVLVWFLLGFAFYACLYAALAVAGVPAGGDAERHHAAVDAAASAASSSPSRR